jgi:hypothetical protein
LILSSQACFKKVPLRPASPTPPSTATPAHPEATAIGTETPRVIATPTTTPTTTPACYSTLLDLGSTSGIDVVTGAYSAAQGADLNLLGQTNALGAVLIRTQLEWNTVFANAPIIPAAPVDFNTTMLVVVANGICCPTVTHHIDRVCLSDTTMDIDLTSHTASVVCMAFCIGQQLTALAVPNNNLPIHWNVTQTGDIPISLTPIVVPTWDVTPTP